MGDGIGQPDRGAGADEERDELHEGHQVVGEGEVGEPGVGGLGGDAHAHGSDRDDVRGLQEEREGWMEEKRCFAIKTRF